MLSRKTMIFGAGSRREAIPHHDAPLLRLQWKVLLMRHLSLNCLFLLRAFLKAPELIVSGGHFPRPFWILLYTLRLGRVDWELKPDTSFRRVPCRRPHKARIGVVDVNKVSLKNWIHLEHGSCIALSVCLQQTLNTFTFCLIIPFAYVFYLFIFVKILFEMFIGSR